MGISAQLTIVLDGGVAALPTFELNLPGHHGVVLETIKRGEDDEAGQDKTVILRLYEGIGGKSKGELTV